jgi:hypothetical protein
MPVSEELSVRFVGDSSGLSKETKKAEDHLKGFNKVSDKVSSALNKQAKAQGAATQSLTNLSRVAQDAPYGFIGIANNLNPLLESFQRLRLESGSNATALKALGSSLAGAGGIGLALGVVSSLAVVFGDKLFGAKKATEENKNEVIASTTAYEKFREELSHIVDSVGKEATKISLLQNALGDSNISLSERKNLIHALNEAYPGYLAKLGDEKSKYDALKTSIDGSIQSLALAAEIKAIFPSVEKVFSEAIAAQVELNRLRRINKPGGFFGLDAADFKAEEKQLQTTIARALNEVGHAKKALADLAGGSANLFEILFGKVAAAPKDAINKTLDKEVDAAKKAIEQRRLEIMQWLNQPFQTNDFKQELSDKLQRDLIEINPSDKLTTLRPKVVVIPEFITDPAKMKAALQAQLVTNINSALSTAAQQIAVDSFAAVGQGIADAITGGGFQDAFQALGQSLGSVIQQLGKEMIALSPLIQAIKVSITNPAGLLAAGVGLVALGGIIKNSLGKVQAKGFADGGLVFGPTLGLIGEGRGTTRSNPEVIAPLNKLAQYVGGGAGGSDRLIAKVKGDELSLILSRNSRKQSRLA